MQRVIASLSNRPTVPRSDLTIDIRNAAPSEEGYEYSLALTFNLMGFGTGCQYSVNYGVPNPEETGVIIAKVGVQPRTRQIITGLTTNTPYSTDHPEWSDILQRGVDVITYIITSQATNLNITRDNACEYFKLCTCTHLAKQWEVYQADLTQRREAQSARESRRPRRSTARSPETLVTAMADFFTWYENQLNTTTGQLQTLFERWLREVDTDRAGTSLFPSQPSGSRP